MRFWKQLLLVGGALALLCAIVSTGLAAQDARRFRQGLTPVGVALVDDFRYGDTDAVILRRTQATPHDVILLRSSAASGQLLASSIAMLGMVHVQQGACPAANSVVRVRDFEGRRTPEWTERDSVQAEATIRDLRAKALRHVPDVGQARLKRIWVRRYYGPREPFPGPDGPRTSVC